MCWHDPGPTPFDDLDDYLALAAGLGLAVSADGSRVVTTVAELNAAKTEFVTAVWELDPAGAAPARRLTRGAKGEVAPDFTADGDLLFLAARPDRRRRQAAGPLWRLPAAGGEAVQAGWRCPAVSPRCGRRRAHATVVVAAPLLPSADDVDDDRRLRTLRKDNKMSARSCTPAIRCGTGTTTSAPTSPHLFGVDADAGISRPDPAIPGGALRDADFDVSADGTFVVTTWQVPAPGAAHPRHVWCASTSRPAQRAVIADDPGADLDTPAISPDGTTVAFTRETVSTPPKRRESRCAACA